MRAQVKSHHAQRRVTTKMITAMGPPMNVQPVINAHKDNHRLATQVPQAQEDDSPVKMDAKAAS